MIMMTKTMTKKEEKKMAATNSFFTTNKVHPKLGASNDCVVCFESLVRI